MVKKQTPLLTNAVEIIGMGYSLRNYRRRCKDVWGISYIPLATECTMGLIMDDWRHLHEYNSPMIQKFMRLGIPMLTSKVYPEYPTTIEFPMKRIMEMLNMEPDDHALWFTNSTPYGIAYAIWLGYEEIHLHGIDFLYKTGVRLKERECTVFWIGIARGRGIKIKVNPASFLLDRNDIFMRKTKQHKFYGYKKQPNLNRKGYLI